MMFESPKYTSASYVPLNSQNDFQQTENRGKRNCREQGLDDEDRPQKRIRIQFHSFFQNEDPSWKIKSCYSCGVVGLHEEINDFYETMRPTVMEIELRTKVIQHVTRVVHSLWPKADVKSFGSFATSLFLPTSDIDLVVSGRWSRLPLDTLCNALKSNGIKKNDITTVPHAKVPLVRMTHTPSKVKVDISFNMTNGVKMVEIIKAMIQRHPALPKLVFVLKQFLVHRNLNEVFNGGMSSYCLTLLIISLLQGYYKPKCPRSSNLGTLLLEFFELYGINFNYQKVGISFSNGGCYQPRYRGIQSTHMLQIEDPLLEGSDIAKGSFLMYQIKQAFENSYRLLHQAVTESRANNRPFPSFLHLVLDVDEQILEKREWMRQNYSEIVNFFINSYSELSGMNHAANNMKEMQLYRELKKKIKKKKYKKKFKRQLK